MHKVGRKLDVAGPWITEKEIAYVTDAVTNCWYGAANKYVDEFENAFTKYLGRKYAISLPSCTAGLHLSLLALGIKEGDEVIVPDATWIASAAPIDYVGAKTVFADIDKDTWCLSADSVEKCITSRTKAIISVNLYGHMPDYDKLESIAKKHNISIIEDAAESVGSRYKGKLSGTFGEFSCFSFHGSKTLTTGEGGMLVTDDEELYKKCMIFRDHGRNPGDTLFQNIMVGYKYKMSSLQAALGLAQLERVDDLVEKKRQIFHWYEKAFTNTPGVSLNPNHKDVYNSYWMSTLLYDPKLYPITKFELIQKLKGCGVLTRPFFDPLSSLKAYDLRELEKVNVNSYKTSAHGINLPSNLLLEEADIAYVKEHILKILSYDK